MEFYTGFYYKNKGYEGINGCKDNIQYNKNTEYGGINKCKNSIQLLLRQIQIPQGQGAAALAPIYKLQQKSTVDLGL